MLTNNHSLLCIGGCCGLFKKFILLVIINIYLAALGLRCCVCALSSCGEWGLLFVARRGLLLLWNIGSRGAGFSGCSMWAQQLWFRGLVALKCVESS